MAELLFLFKKAQFLSFCNHVWKLFETCIKIWFAVFGPTATPKICSCNALTLHVILTVAVVKKKSHIKLLLGFASMMIKEMSPY